MIFEHIRHGCIIVDVARNGRKYPVKFCDPRHIDSVPRLDTPKYTNTESWSLFRFRLLAAFDDWVREKLKVSSCTIVTDTRAGFSHEEFYYDYPYVGQFHDRSDPKPWLPSSLQRLIVQTDSNNILITISSSSPSDVDETVNKLLRC